MIIGVLGANGQLGQDVVREAVRRGHEVVQWTRPLVAVEDDAAVRRAIGSAKPEAVIHCAAWTDVEAAEGDPRRAFAVNAVGSLHVARAVSRVAAKLLYVGTDYVFGGEKPGRSGTTSPQSSYLEGELPAPLNVYGASKLAGEHATLLAAPNAVVCRVSGLFGASPPRGKARNFVQAILAKAREGQVLRVVDDQWITPTYTVDAAKALLQLAVDGQAHGTFHVTNPEACTWHSFAEEAVRQRGLDAKVEPVHMENYPSKARRPRNSALDTTKLQTVLGGRLRPWKEALSAYLANDAESPTDAI